MRGPHVEAAARSISDVLIDIGRNAQSLMRSEIRLAQSDARDRVLSAWPAALLYAIGAGAALLAAFFSMLAILFALRLVMPGWAAAVCVAVALAIAATLVIKAAVQRFRASPPLFKVPDASNEEAAWNPRREMR